MSNLKNPAVERLAAEKRRAAVVADADVAGDDAAKTDRPVATLRGSATARPRMTTDEILALTR